MTRDATMGFLAHCSHTDLNMDAAMGILFNCSHRDWTREDAMLSLIHI